MNLSSTPLYADSNTLHLESFVSGPLQTNTFLLVDKQARHAIVIDPSILGDEAFARARQLQTEGITLQAIWNTHGHFDHIYDNARWKSAFGVPVLAHPDDEFFLENLREQSIWFGLPAPETTAIDQYLSDGETLHVGGFSCQVLTLAGHSPGSVGFYFESQKMIVGGDVLFEGSVGRTDLPGSSAQDLAASLHRLFALPPQTEVHTGHGPSTTLESEKRHNEVARALLSRF